MTLITHIWSKDLNVISGDGRVTNSLTKQVVNDSLKKIYEKDNYFIAFHGDCDVENISIPKEIDTFLKNYINTTPQILVNDILNHLVSLNPKLETGLFIGGQDSELTHSIFAYVNGSVIKNDHIDYTSGFRFNYDTEEHKNDLMNCYKSSFKIIFERDYSPNETYESISNEQFKDFLSLFHQCAFTKANPTNGIGQNVDIGIIRKGKFEWLVNNNVV